MDGFSLQERASWRSFSTWPNWAPLERCHPFGAHVAIGDNLEELAIILANVTMLGADELYGICNNRIKHRLEFSGRGSDDAEDFTGRGLLFQRLSEIMVAFLELLEQAHVFDGDHGLVSEGFKQFDLLIAERPNLESPDKDSANGNTLAKQGCRNDRMISTNLPTKLGVCERAVIDLCQIMNMHGLAVHDSATHGGGSTN